LRATRRAPLQIAPPIRFQDGFIEFVVDLPEQGDEALVVDLLVLGGEGFSGAEFFEHVVDAGEREAGIQLLLALAVRVQTLAEIADALLEGAFFQRGEGEGIEADGFVVAWAVFKRATASKCPCDMNA
jgi:hypothetical protein